MGGEPIRIQQDGAKAHLASDPVTHVVTDREWLEELSNLGLEGRIILHTQPANSLDVNVNDLGFFNLLQSQYWRTNPLNANQLIKMVLDTFAAYDKGKLNRIWLTYMMVLNKILEHGGRNDYKLGHLKKAKLERQGQLPVTLEAFQPAKEPAGGNENEI